MSLNVAYQENQNASLLSSITSADETRAGLNEIYGNVWNRYRLPYEPIRTAAVRLEALARFQQFGVKTPRLGGPIENGLLGKLRENYIFSTDNSVKDFLFYHRSLPELLCDAVAPLRKHFGNSAFFALRLPIDPGGLSILYAVVLWSGSVAEARTSLDDFDRSWWIERAHRGGGHLTFTYELI